MIRNFSHKSNEIVYENIVIISIHDLIRKWIGMEMLRHKIHSYTHFFYFYTLCILHIVDDNKSYTVCHLSILQ